MGDFNVALALDESSVSGSKITLAMQVFMDCVEELRMDDLNQTGLRFTWNQKPQTSDGILRKIDRIMVNDDFLGDLVNAYAYFHPYRMSDHSPGILKIPSFVTKRAKMFRFSNFIVYREGFDDLDKGNLHSRVLKLRNELDEVQKALDINPSSMVLREYEGCLLRAYTDAVLEEERYLKQKGTYKLDP
ncbi:uncharacterized protein [Rutidosis leptorrhynchoides]|uniref:uncharacterized protein n=1 Tax=Rutidosis leptorrhynchoides TaxID=125765 RepID=UPI003A9A4E42